MLNSHELRALELDKELAGHRATQAEARFKIAELEAQRAMLALGSAPSAAVRSGLGFVVVALAIGLVVAVASAAIDAPDHTAATTTTGAGR